MEEKDLKEIGEGVFLNTSTNEIILAETCPNCKKTSLDVFTIDELEKIVKKARKG